MDISGESLSAFASEQELAVAPPPALVGDSSISYAVAESATAMSSPEEHPPRVVRRSWPRLLVAALTLVLLAQTALLAWIWLANDRRWPVFASTTASVTVTSDPAGAAVLVDGQARGTTPVTMTLATGRHQVQVGVEGSAWTQTVDVAPGVSATLHVAVPAPALALDAAREGGTLEITTEPAGLAVSVDGEPRGVSPISVSDLRPGTHEVAVARGTSLIRRTVSVEAGVPTAVLISTAGNAGISSGWLTVTGPVPVRIQENGTLLGNSEAPRLLLPVGRHDLEFVNETFGYRSERTVQITAGQAATIALEPVTGTLSVNAQPWAEVWIDGKRIGETPIGNLPLPIGNHDLLLRHPQLGDRRRTVAVSANTPARVGIDLRQ